jgi:hypothetical protein
MDDNRRTDATGTQTHSSTPGWLIAIIVIVALVIGAFALGLVNIDQVRGAKVPNIAVEASGGQVPVFDIDTAKIDVGSKKQSVEVPTVDVGSTKTEIDVPTISVDRVDNPDAKDK